MSKKPIKKQKEEVKTTGHSWDGIEEYDNPMPRWWLYTLYVCMIWAVGYSIAYPAWPMLTEATPGLLGWSSRADVAADIKRYDEANAEIEQLLVDTPLTEVAANVELAEFAVNAGEAVFETWCVQCHQASGQGATGYPALLDDDWLWGGDIDAIYTTIAHGVRNEDDDDAHYSEMPAFGSDEILSEEEIAQVVNHILTISGSDADATLATAGAVVFEDNCSSCHGEDAKGDRDQGAPNLTDAIWLYGGDSEALTKTVTYSRFGVMPAWSVRLNEADIKAVASYVHQLGGGE